MRLPNRKQAWNIKLSHAEDGNTEHFIAKAKKTKAKKITLLSAKGENTKLLSAKAKNTKLLSDKARQVPADN